MNHFFKKIIRKIGIVYINTNKRYDQSYFFNHHTKWLNSFFFGFLIKLYYWYIAFYIMAKAAKLKKNDKILDIGCGAGALVEQFNRLGYQAIGVDVEKEAIKNSIYPQKCFLVQTTAKLPYPDNYFNLVVSREVLEHIPVDHIDACIDEWDRVSIGKMVHLIAVRDRGSSAIDDVTHVNVQFEKWWIKKFAEYDYRAIIKPQKFFFSLFGTKGYLMFIKNV